MMENSDWRVGIGVRRNEGGKICILWLSGQKSLAVL